MAGDAGELSDDEQRGRRAAGRRVRSSAFQASASGLLGLGTAGSLACGLVTMANGEYALPLACSFGLGAVALGCALWLAGRAESRLARALLLLAGVPAALMVLNALLGAARWV